MNEEVEPGQEGLDADGVEGLNGPIAGNVAEHAPRFFRAAKDANVETRIGTIGLTQGNGFGKPFVGRIARMPSNNRRP